MILWCKSASLVLLLCLLGQQLGKTIATDSRNDNNPDGASPVVDANNGLVEDNGRMTSAAQKALRQQQLENKQNQENEGKHGEKELKEQMDQVTFQEWLKEYQDTGSQPNMTPSVKRYMKDNNLTIDDVIEMYDLEPGTNTDRKRSGAINFAGIWTKCIVPYKFDPALPEKQKAAAIAGMKLMEKETGFRFPPFNDSNAVLGLDHDNYLIFYDGDGCHSGLGNKRTKGQKISACTGATVIHELGHALGMGHEQAMPGNMPILDTHYKEISYIFSYARWNLEEVFNSDKSYDPSSRMHYSSSAFKKDYKPTVTMMDSDFEYMIGSGNYYYLFKAIQEYNKCYDEYSTCSPLPVCEIGGYPSIMDGKCTCRCPGVLDPNNSCKTVVPKEPSPPWPLGKYSFLKSTASPCPAGFETGTMYNYPAYYSWDGGDYHLDPHNAWELAHRVCTRSDDGSTASTWPAGSYCILRYGGSCPNGFQEGKAECWGLVPQKTDVGTVPDGEHGQFFEYIFCCRSDKVETIPIDLPYEKSFILFPASGKSCQEVKSMNWISERFTTRSNFDEKMVFRTGTLPEINVYSNYTQHMYYCAYLPFGLNEPCDVVKTFSDSESSYTFTTPNFPEKYPTLASCEWYLKSPEGTRMQLDFEEFEVSHSTDTSCQSHVEVKSFLPGSPGFKFCGHKYARTHWTNGNYLTVKFVSGEAEPWKGFKAKVQVLKAENQCYKGDGRDRSYAGTVTYDKSFSTCLPWSKVTQCPFHQFDSRFVDEDLAENNYCRNIGIGGQPWCYTNAEMCYRQNCDACMTGSCFNLFSDCDALTASESSYCKKNENGEAVHGCKKSCNLCSQHVAKMPVTCGVPPEVNGVQAVPASASYKVGDVVMYKCPTSTDFRESVCTSEGTWTQLNFICGACPSGWAVRDKKCYKYMDWDVNIDHEAATSVCAGFGAHLIQVDSKEKQQILEDMVDYYPEPMNFAWVGLTKNDDGKWVWPDGSEVSWNWWNNGQPDDIPEEKCVATDYYGGWDDKPCTNKYNVVCEYEPKGPFTCEDQLSNCHAIIRTTPDVCSKYTDYAWANCRKTCGVGDCSDGVTCADDANLGNTGTRVAGSNSINVGQHVRYECVEGHYHIAGDLTRACLPSGSLTGSAPTCSGTVTNIEFFGDSSIFGRASRFASDDTYVTPGGKLSFPFGGKVTSWTFFSHIKDGEIAFQVFRPLPDPAKSLTLTFIGQNAITALPSQRIHTAQIPEAEQITVQKGDIIGIYVKGDELSFDWCTDKYHPGNGGWMYTKASTRPNEVEVGKNYDFVKSYIKCRMFTVKANLSITG